MRSYNVFIYQNIIIHDKYLNNYLCTFDKVLDQSIYPLFFCPVLWIFTFAPPRTDFSLVLIPVRGDWTCNSRWITCLVACTQVFFLIICQWDFYDLLQCFCQIIFFKTFWIFLIAAHPLSRGENEARKALVWLRGTSQVWEEDVALNILNILLANIKYMY